MRLGRKRKQVGSQRMTDLEYAEHINLITRIIESASAIPPSGARDAAENIMFAGYRFDPEASNRSEALLAQLQGER